jgi:hypothetical protein
MNLLKIQDMLKGTPDEKLIGYVQNPSGQVPTYLALSELQRRKEMRASYQANKPEDKSVAEDLVQEAQPQVAGLAGLPEAQPMMEAMQPPPEMPVQQMAQGGLADLGMDNQMFNEENYATGGIVAFNDGGNVQNFEEGGTSRLGDYFRSKINKYDIDRQINDLMAEKNKYRYDYLGSYTPEQRAAAEAKNLDIDKQIADLQSKRNPVTTTQPIQTTPVAPISSKDQTVPPSAVLEAFVPPVSTTGKQSGFGLPKLTVPGDLTIDKAIEERKKAMELAGVPTDFYSSETEKNKTDREALKDEREKAKYFALAKAGFKMASQRPQFGKAQSALADIAEGAEAGLEQYGKDVKDIKAEDRLLKQADRKLAEAQYLQQRGDAEGAMKKISEREALIQDYRKLEYQGKVSLAAASMSANRPDINMELLNSMKQDVEYYKKDAKGNLLKDSKGQPIFDASKAADAIKGYNVKSESNTLKALSDQLKTEIDPIKRKAIQDQINAVLYGEGNVPGGSTKTPTKPLSSFGG